MENGNIQVASEQSIENKIGELVRTNYSVFYKNGFLVDYNIRNQWRVGIIVDRNGDSVDVKDFISPTEFVTIKMSNQNKISYFRKHTKGNINYNLIDRVTSSKNVNDIRSVLDTILEQYNFDNSEKMKNSNAYRLLFIFRGKLLYYLDILMSEISEFQVTDIDLVVQNLKKYLLIIKKLFEFYKNNNELLKNYDSLRNTYYEDMIVLDWKYAIVSSFPEAIIMLRKILGRDERIAPFYSKYKKEFKKIMLEKPKKEQNNKIPKRCVPDAYETKLSISFKRFSIPAFPIAYLTDYFFYIEGYKLLSDVIISNSGYSPIVVESFLTPFDDAYYLANNFKNVLHDEIEIMRNYVNTLIEKMSETDIKEYSKDILINIIKKIVSIYPVKDGGIFEGMYLIYYYRLFICKTLEKQIFAMNKFNEIINTIEYKTNQMKSGKDKKQISGDIDPLINNITFEQLAIVFKEKKIVDILFEDNIHDEIFKRSIKLMKLMYTQNWCLKDKEQIEKYNISIFDKLWIKGFSKKNSKNDESFTEWIKDYICEFCEGLSEEHKLYFYRKIQIYVKEGPITKDNIIFLRNFALKCINPGNSIINELDKNILNDEHLYGIKLIWEYMQDEQDNAKQGEDNYSIFS